MIDCEQVREALSAGMDGEQAPAGVGQRALGDHLARCGGCRRWLEEAEAVNRLYRLRPAPVVPDLSATVLAAVGEGGAGRGRRPFGEQGKNHGPNSRWERSSLSRLALVLVGLAQLGFALPALVLGAYRGAPPHVSHELGALDVALAAGFVFAATRPASAWGVAVVAAAAALGLSITGLVGIAAGTTTWTLEAPHLLVLAGMLLAGAVARSPSSPPIGGRPRVGVGLRRDQQASSGPSTPSTPQAPEGAKIVELHRGGEHPFEGEAAQRCGAALRQTAARA